MNGEQQIALQNTQHTGDEAREALAGLALCSVPALLFSASADAVHEGGRGEGKRRRAADTQR